MKYLKFSVLTGKRMKWFYLFLVSVFIYVVYVDGYISDRLMEEKILESIIDAKNEDNKGVTFIDIEEITGKEISQLCVQYPYMMKSMFEEALGAEASTFYGVNDSLNILWVFFTDDSILKVRIKRWKYIHKWKVGDFCVPSSRGLLVVRDEDDMYLKIKGE